MLPECPREHPAPLLKTWEKGGGGLFHIFGIVRVAVEVIIDIQWERTWLYTGGHDEKESNKMVTKTMEMEGIGNER
jgi:hypothetical protein